MNREDALSLTLPDVSLTLPDVSLTLPVECRAVSSIPEVIEEAHEIQDTAATLVSLSATLSPSRPPSRTSSRTPSRTSSRTPSRAQSGVPSPPPPYAPVLLDPPPLIRCSQGYVGEEERIYNFSSSERACFDIQAPEECSSAPLEYYAQYDVGQLDESEKEGSEKLEARHDLHQEPVPVQLIPVQLIPVQEPVPVQLIPVQEPVHSAESFRNTLSFPESSISVKRKPLALLCVDELDSKLRHELDVGLQGRVMKKQKLADKTEADDFAKRAFAGDMESISSDSDDEGQKTATRTVKKLSPEFLTMLDTVCTSFTTLHQKPVDIAEIRHFFQSKLS
jgi:hypothetical protein